MIENEEKYKIEFALIRERLLRNLPTKILLPRFDTIGDIVLLEGLLEALLNKYPEAEIVFAVQESYSELKPLFPERIKWITTKVHPHREPDIEGLNSLLNQLSQEHYDLILTTTFNRTYIDDAVALKLDHILNIAIGEERKAPWYFKKRWDDLGLSGKQINYKYSPVDEFIHETEKYQKFWQSLTEENSLPNPRLRIPGNSAKYAEEFLSSIGLKEKEFYVCNPAGIANVVIKAWPEDKFADVISWLERDYNLRALLTGHLTEQERIEKVASLANNKGASPLIWLGKDGEIPLLAAITQRAKLYFGNDTGPMHIASALRIPTIGIFGGGFWPRFLPVGSHSIGLAGVIPCFGCDWDCIFGDAPCVRIVSVNDAQKAIDIALQGKKLDSNMFLSSHKINEETMQYIEKATMKFKSLKTDLISRLDESESDRAERLEIINRQSKEFAEKLNACEADRAARLDVINKQGAEIGDLKRRIQQLEAAYWNLVHQKGK
jgi:ADP-heptose:LPS heptosyltransferase